MPRAPRMIRELPPVLTVNQFATLYQINVTTVLKLIKEGKIPAQKISHSWRIRNDYATFQALPELNDSYHLREVEVAELLNCTPRNVRYLCDDGKLRFKWHNQNRRFCVKDVHVYLAMRKHPKPRSGKRPEMITWAKRQLEALDAMG